MSSWPPWAASAPGAAALTTDPGGRYWPSQPPISVSSVPCARQSRTRSSMSGLNTETSTAMPASPQAVTGTSRVAAGQALGRGDGFASTSTVSTPYVATDATAISGGTGASSRHAGPGSPPISTAAAASPTAVREQQPDQRASLSGCDNRASPAGGSATRNPRTRFGAAQQQRDGRDQAEQQETLVRQGEPGQVRPAGGDLRAERAAELRGQRRGEEVLVERRAPGQPRDQEHERAQHVPHRRPPAVLASSARRRPARGRPARRPPGPPGWSSRRTRRARRRPPAGAPRASSRRRGRAARTTGPRSRTARRRPDRRRLAVSTAAATPIAGRGSAPAGAAAATIRFTRK